MSIISRSTLDVNGDNCPQMWSTCDATQSLAPRGFLIHRIDENVFPGGVDSKCMKWCPMLSSSSANQIAVRRGGEFR